MGTRILMIDINRHPANREAFAQELMPQDDKI